MPFPLHRAVILLALLAWGHSSISQKTRIRILNARTLEYDDRLGKDVQRLKGNVKFENRGSLLDCDSAYFYPNSNIKAFGNIRLNQGDTLFLNADKLYFNAKEKKTLADGNVLLRDQDMRLTSDHLTYLNSQNMAFYQSGGTIVTGANILSSKRGYYSSVSKMLSFKDSVELKNPQYTMYADTLRFNITTEIAYFSGPTTIVTKDSEMYTEKGWYNTRTDYTELTLNNWFQSKSQHLKADSILYDRNLLVGKAFKNVTISDTANDLTIIGEYGQYNQMTNRSFVTQKATMIQAFERDSLFLHADTLKLYSDTVSDLNEVYAYHRVRFFRKDIQGICDSLTYIQVDSLIRMFVDPVLWSETNQLTGDYMEIELDEGVINQLNIFDHSFIISRIDSTNLFNQIKGRDMKAFFKNNELDRIYVNGNGQTLYFAQEDEGGKFIGMNKADCSNILVKVKKNQIHKLIFLEQPLGALTPMSKIDRSALELNDFRLRENERPKDKEDIYHD